MLDYRTLMELTEQSTHVSRDSQRILILRGRARHSVRHRLNKSASRKSSTQRGCCEDSAPLSRPFTHHAAVMALQSPARRNHVRL